MNEGRWRLSTELRLANTQAEGKVETDFAVCPHEASGTLLRLVRTQTEFLSQNYNFTFNVKMASGGGNGQNAGSWGVAWRVQDRKNFYLFDWHQGDGCMAMWEVDDKQFKELDSGSRSMQLDRVYKVELIADGADFSISIDGQRVLSGDDGTRKTGGVALWTSGTATVSFDDLVVVELKSQQHLSTFTAPTANLCGSRSAADCYYNAFSVTSDREIDLDDARDEFLAIEDGGKSAWGDKPEWFIDASRGALRQSIDGGTANDVADLCRESFGTFALAVPTESITHPERKIAVKWVSRDDDSIGVMFNVQRPLRGIRETFSYYRLDWNRRVRCFSLTRFRQGEFFLIANVTSSQPQTDREVVVEFVFLHNELTLYVDAERVATLPAAVPRLDIAYGGVALYSRQNSRVEFHDLLVYGYGPTRSTVAPGNSGNLANKRFVGSVRTTRFHALQNDRTVSPTRSCGPEVLQRASIEFDVSRNTVRTVVEQIVDEVNRRYYPGVDEQMIWTSVSGNGINIGDHTSIDPRAPAADTWCQFGQLSNSNNNLTINFRGRDAAVPPLTLPILDARNVGPRRSLVLTLAPTGAGQNASVARIVDGVAQLITQAVGAESALAYVNGVVRTLGSSSNGSTYLGFDTGTNLRASTPQIAFPIGVMGSQFADGTSDGVKNYAIATSGANNSVPVFMFNLDWSNATFLWNHDANACTGIAYDGSSKGLMMLCDSRIRARRISDGLPLVQPDILLPSDILMQSFLAHDFVLADFIWTSFAPGTLSQLARNGTVLQRDIEVDNMAGYVVRGGSFDATAITRRRDVAEQQVVAGEVVAAAGDEDRKRTAFGCTATATAPTCSATDYTRLSAGALVRTDDSLAYDPNFPPAIRITKPAINTQLALNAEVRVTIFCLYCVGGEVVSLELLDQNAIATPLVETGKMGTSFPFGHEASIKFRVATGHPAGPVQIRATINGVTGTPRATLNVRFTCVSCSAPSGATLSTCAPACTDPNGCELIGNVRQCFGSAINCRRVVAGWVGSACQRYAAELPARCDAATGACTPATATKFCPTSLGLEQNDNGRCLDIRCKNPNACQVNSDALLNNDVAEVCLTNNTRGGCDFGEGCDNSGQCVRVPVTPAPTPAPSPAPTPPPTPSPTPFPTPPPTPLPPFVTAPPTPRPTPLPPTPFPTPVPPTPFPTPPVTPRPTPPPTPFPTPAPTPMRDPCDPCLQTFGSPQVNEDRWCRCCSLDCGNNRANCLSSGGMCTRYCNSTAFCQGYVAPGVPTPAPVGRASPPCGERSTCDKCAGAGSSASSGATCAWCEVSGGGYCDDLTAPRMLQCGDRPAANKGILYNGGRVPKPVCTAPDRCQQWGSDCQRCVSNQCGMCRDKFGVTQCYGLGFEGVCKDDAGVFFSTCPTLSPTPLPTPSPTPAPSPAPTPETSGQTPAPGGTDTVPSTSEPMGTTLAPYKGGNATVLDPATNKTLTIVWTADGKVTVTDDANMDVTDKVDVQVGKDKISVDTGGDTVISIDRRTGEVDAKSTVTGDGVAVQPPCVGDGDADGDAVPDCADTTLTVNLADDKEIKQSFYRPVGAAGARRLYMRMTGRASSFSGDMSGKLDVTPSFKGSAKDAGLIDAAMRVSAVVDIKVGDAPATEAKKKRAAALRETWTPKVVLCLPAQSSPLPAGSCLAAYSASAGRWACTDTTLEEVDGLQCGEADHPAAYAVVVPQPDETTVTVTTQPVAPQSGTEECEESIIECFPDMYLWIIIGVVGGLLLIAIIVCIVCAVRKREPPSAVGARQQPDEFLSSRNSSEMAPMVPYQQPPPPSRAAGGISYAQSSLARKDLEVEFVEEISDSSDSDDDLVIGL